MPHPARVRYSWDSAGGAGNLYAAARIRTRLPAAPFELVLGPAVHVVDIHATDAGGAPARAFPRGGALHWQVTVGGRSGGPMVGATVHGSVVGPDGRVLGSTSATTGSGGRALLAIRLRSDPPPGNYQLNVSEIAKAGMTYDRSEDARTMVVATVR